MNLHSTVRRVAMMSQNPADHNVEKANVIAEYFTKLSSTASYSEEFRDHKKTFEKENKDLFQLQSQFWMSEFKKVLKKGENTALGKDPLC